MSPYVEFLSFFFLLSLFFFSPVRSERAKTNRRHCSLRALKSGWGKSPYVTVAVCTAVCVWAHSGAAVGVTGHSNDGEGSACGLCCQTLPGLSHMCHTVLQVPAFTSRPSITLPTLFGHPGCITLFHTPCWPPCQPWQLLG